MTKRWKTQEEMMMSPEWAATDKAGRAGMMEEHGFGLKKAAPELKSPYRPGKTGELQRAVQKPLRLGELTDALTQQKKKKGR